MLPLSRSLPLGASLPRIEQRLMRASELRIDGGPAGQCAAGLGLGTRDPPPALPYGVDVGKPKSTINVIELAVRLQSQT
jgi:hypothetical protein